MHQCLRCNNPCANDVAFCQKCQIALLESSPGQERSSTFFSAGTQGHVLSPAKPPVSALSKLPVTPVLPELSPISAEHMFPSSLAPTTPRPAYQRIWLRRRWRIIAAVLLLLALADGALAFFYFRSGQGGSAQPALVLEKGVVAHGEAIELRLSSFTPRAHVRIMRDMQVAVRLLQTPALPHNQPVNYVQIDEAGKARVRLQIDANWEAGEHIVQAEDATTRNVASATLHVVGAVQPPSLQLSQTALDMGASLQGSNSIQSLRLRNTGGGTISWTIGNLKPAWLFTTPTFGTFSDGENVFLAVSRAGLQPGEYKGSLLIMASTGGTQKVAVKMTVKPLPGDPGPVLTVSPPAVAASTFDGATDVVEDTLKITNTGNKPLHWSLASQVQLASLSEESGFQQRIEWLHVDPRMGNIAPGKTEIVHVSMQSQSLFTDVYSGIISFQADQKALNSPQSIALSLMVRPPCEAQPSVTSILARVSTGQKAILSHQLSLHVPGGCREKLSWQASSQSDWLTVSPAQGTLDAQSSTDMALTVDGTKLAPGLYTGSFVLKTAQSSQMISVQTTVLPTGAQTASSLAVTPAHLSFTLSPGQASSTQQSLSLANTGQAGLSWQITGGAPWLLIQTLQGALDAGGSVDIPVRVTAADLAAGSYTAQVQVTAMDSTAQAVMSGPQTVAINLMVTQQTVQTCTFSASPSTLTFQATLLDTTPQAQEIALTSTGACGVTWNASTDASWISLSSTTGSNTSGGNKLSIAVNSAGKILGTYRGHVTLTAYDSNGASIKGSPQVITIVLNVLG